MFFRIVSDSFKRKPRRKLLTAAGALFVFAGIIANLHIYFQPATLFHTLVMLVLLVGGLGLIARSLGHHNA